MSALQRAAFLLSSWVCAFLVYAGATSLLSHYDGGSRPGGRSSVIVSKYTDNRLQWCIRLDDRLRATSRWNPAAGPVPLSPEGAMGVAQREFAALGVGQYDPASSPAPALQKIEDARSPPEGDFYYYLSERRTARDERSAALSTTNAQSQPSAVAVLLDGTAIASTAVDCPDARRGPGGHSGNSDFRSFLIIFTAAAAALTFVLYTPLAVLLGQRVRRRWIVALSIVSVLGAALGLVRTWLLPGLDEWMVVPPAMDFALLLGALPVVGLVELAVRSVRREGA